MGVRETTCRGGAHGRAGLSWVASARLLTAAGFAAIGAAEGLVHGHDIAAGLEVPWSPGQRPCEQLLSAVFPGAARSALGSAFEDLLAQTGRARRPQHEPPTEWNYTASAALPLGGQPGPASSAPPSSLPTR